MRTARVKIARAVSRTFTPAAVAAVALAAAMMLAQSVSPAPMPTVWDGIFTAPQAQRGAEIFAARCIECHGPDMRGGPAVPSLVGAALYALWGGKSLAELSEKIRLTMPATQPGSLSPDESVDIVASLLQANGFPVGDAAELTAGSPLLTQVTLPLSFKR